MRQVNAAQFVGQIRAAAVKDIAGEGRDDGVPAEITDHVVGPRVLDVLNRAPDFPLGTRSEAPPKAPKYRPRRGKMTRCVSGITHDSHSCIPSGIALIVSGSSLKHPME